MGWQCHWSCRNPWICRSEPREWPLVAFLHPSKLTAFPLVGRARTLRAQERPRKAVDPSLLHFLRCRRRREVFIQRSSVLARDVRVGDCINDEPLLAPERTADDDLVP